MPTRRQGAHLSIANGIREFAIASASVTAVIDGDRRLTYAALDERSNRLAQALVCMGLAPGARVAVALGNRLEYPEIACGIAKAGLVSVPLNPRLTAPEVTYIVGHSGASAAIVDDALAARVAPAVEAHDVRHVLDIDGRSVGPAYEDALGAADARDPHLDASELDPFTVCYTAGTTGKPKGVVISHRSRVLTFYCTALEWGLGPGRTTIAVAPMYHGAGFAFAYAAVHTGGTLVMMRSFDPERLLQMVAHDRPESVFLVPAHVHMVRGLGDEAVRRHDRSALRTIYVNAAPMPQELKVWTIGMFPDAGLHELYGSTEASIVTNLRPPDQLRKERCVGPPWFMTEVRVVNDDGRPVATGEAGELWSRSPFVFQGYLDDQEATAAATTADGFVSAGDVAVLDDERYVYIVDRRSDMIISGGVNIYPREVEEVLFEHPGVADVSVIGAPDEKWGERLVAVVVARDPGLREADLIEFTRQRLAGFKVPKEVRFRAVLPRNAAGKVVKSDLREEQPPPSVPP